MLERNGTAAQIAPDRPISVLIVDDNPGDRDLAIAYLEESPGEHELASAASLAEAAGALERRCPDVILLDLGLPDSQGLDTFHALSREVPEIPIVVITGLDDDAVGVAAVKSGAQDYLIKGRAGPELLSRALRYAIERHHLQRQLELERGRREREREDMAEHGLGPMAGVASRLYGRKPLREMSSVRFAAYVTEYGRLLLMALENQVTRVDRSVSPQLRELAGKLGAETAGPRDVVEVHKAALAEAGADQPPQKARAMTEEGRFLVLELMGHLVSYYRTNQTSARAAEPSEGAASDTSSRSGGQRGES